MTVEGNNQFYVYAFFRMSGVPCYIGKGCGDRWNNRNRTHNRHLQNIFKKEPDLPVVIVRSGISEAEAFEIEMALIAAIGRTKNGGPLVNATDGGEGVKGHSHSEETRRKLRQARNGREISPESTQKTADALRGRRRPPEVGERISAALKGRRHTPDQVAKNSAGQTGKTMSVEARSKISEALKLRKRSSDTGKLISDSLKNSEAAKASLKKAVAANADKSIVEVFGEKIRFRDAVKLYGCAAESTIRLRIRNGMSLEQALMKPGRSNPQRGYENCQNE